MRAYLFALLKLSALLLVVFALAVAVGFEAWLGDPQQWLAGLGPWAAVVSVALLWADVVLPIPSSLLMVANGACFGLVAGASLSLIGGVGATLIAWWIGNSSQNLFKVEMNTEERLKTEKYLTKWGAFAITTSRPIPILAESVALLSSTLPMTPLSIGLYAALGHLIPCVLYAEMGARFMSGR